MVVFLCYACNILTSDIFPCVHGEENDLGHKYIWTRQCFQCHNPHSDLIFSFLITVFLILLHTDMVRVLDLHEEPSICNLYFMVHLPHDAILFLDGLEW